MVHAIRKAEKKLNAAVFGCCSDSHHFTFLSIDNESRVSIFNRWYCSAYFPTNLVQYSFYHYDWADGGELSLNEIEERKIYTHLRLMIRCATNSTPRTSPVKARRIQDKQKHGKAYYVRFGSEESDVAISGNTAE